MNKRLEMLCPELLTYLADSWKHKRLGTVTCGATDDL
jgi:hypothetical protein